MHDWQQILDAQHAFLSIQAQDFIEEPAELAAMLGMSVIPEHSSSGLH